MGSYIHAIKHRMIRVGNLEENSTSQIVLEVMKRRGECTGLQLLRVLFKLILSNRISNRILFNIRFYPIEFYPTGFYPTGFCST